MRDILKYCWLLYPLFFVSAQENVMHFNTSNGLPHDITYGIFQDRAGFIWVGTDDGLVKFDGQEFKLFSTDDGLRNNFVIDVNQHPNGDILVATWGGGLHVIRNDQVLKLKIPNDENEKINNLQIWNHHIIAKHTRGNILYEHVGDRYIKKLLIKTGDRLKAIRYDKDASGTYYVTVIDNTPFALNDIKTFYHNVPTYVNGLFKFDQGRFKQVAKIFEKRIVNSISKIAPGTYAVSIADSLFILSPQKIARHRLALGTDKKIICKIQKFDREYLVLASNKKGFKDLMVFDSEFKKGINLQKLLKTQSSVSDFLIDNEKNIWVTTNGDGIYCYNKNLTSFVNYTDQVLPETLILDIDQKEKEQYLLSPNFLMRFANGRLIGKTKLSGIGKKITLVDSVHPVVSSLNMERDVVHQGFKEALTFNIINLKKYGNIYVNDSIYVEYYQRKVPALKKIINDAIFYRDTLWLATNVGMYYFLKDARGLIKKNVHSVKLPGEHIRKFVECRNALWIATSKGLCRLKDNRLSYYTQADGLISNQINTMIRDHDEKIWIGTNRGVSVFDGTNFINLTPSRGLLSSFINVIFENDRHQIMIGSDKGVTVIDNTQILKLEQPPLIDVEKNHNSQFRYHVISFNRSNSLVVQYRLDGSPWISLPAPSGVLNFSKEKKGTHQFELRAKKQDGIWGYSQRYAFQISIPWYRDTNVLIFGICLVFLSIVFMVMRQLQKVKRRNQILKDAIDRRQQLEKELTEVRSNIAQDFHDELGNKLARISVISNLAINEVPEDHEKLLRQIIQIENDTNSLYRGTKDFIFSLKDNSNHIEELVTYLSDFGEDLFADTPIRFIVRKNIQSTELLPHYWSKQLIFIFKEALTNVLKHSGGDTIVFEFSYADDELMISCRDNGIGITDEEVKKNSNGLSNMKKRAQKIGGELQIEAQQEPGTTIRFRGKTT